ncbi:MAG: Rieske (2Fe-2S) protein [Candidatus Poribacteria bacterium]|nr:Rieske (2Fe-2S) protein [Candidatus Poribacteria bacterium]
MQISGQNHDIGQISAFESGKLYALHVADTDIVLVRQDNEFFAIRDACPHRGARLSNGFLTGKVAAKYPGDQPKLLRQGECIVCPWHGWKIDVRTGCSLLEPDRIKAKRYNVHIEDGRVFVALPDNEIT